jgi:type I restriction-modification system DNA methylase subunit
MDGGNGFRDEEYLKSIQPNTNGKAGDRPIDTIKRMFHEIQEVVAVEDLDVLGDLYEGAITYGEHGQYFTPDSLCNLLCRLTGTEGKTVHDPACGSGRMLLAAARVNRNREYIGTDKDERCA